MNVLRNTYQDNAVKCIKLCSGVYTDRDVKVIVMGSGVNMEQHCLGHMDALRSIQGTGMLRV